MNNLAKTDMVKNIYLFLHCTTMGPYPLGLLQTMSRVLGNCSKELLLILLIPLVDDICLLVKMCNSEMGHLENDEVLFT